MDTQNYESYWYIHSPPHDHRPGEVLENTYKSTEDVGEKFIVYAKGIGYRVYQNVNMFIQHLNAMEENDRIFHEVIFSVPQKLKFDIDAPIEVVKSFTLPQRLPEKHPCEANITQHDEDLIADLLRSLGEEIVTEQITETVSDNIPCEITNDNIGTGEITNDNINTDEIANESEEAEKYRHIFSVILDAIRDAFFIIYGKNLTSDNEIICESADLTGPVTKFSNHVIIDKYYVTGHSQSCEFTRRLMTLLPKAYHPFLDIGVNKRIQNFRLVNCHKLLSTRVKRIVTGQSPERSIITNVVNCDELDDIVERVAVAHNDTDLHPEDITNVLTLCAEDRATHSHTFKYAKGGLFIFTRDRPSHCEFCNKSHDKDNTLIITTSITHGTIAVFKQCRRYLEVRGRDGHHFSKIGEIRSNVAPDADDFDDDDDDDSGDSGDERPVKNDDDIAKMARWVDSAIKHAVDDLAIRPLYTEDTLFDALGEKLKTDYSATTLRDFELTDTLVVRAAMKMGKTKALVKYLKSYFSGNLRESVIRFVSFRQTFSGNIKEKFSDFTLYSDVKGELDHAKLIIQVESLHRLCVQPGTEVPDLLILDECESIFEQFDSGLLKDNFNECFAKFQYMMRHSKHVICMDANITDRTYRMLKQMRPQFARAVEDESQVVYHYNRHKNAQADKYFVCGDKIKWLGVLYSCIEADEKLAIPMSSLSEAKILVKNLAKKYPEKFIKLYSSETTQREKKEHFADVNNYWNQFDIMVFTPTVSAGVSFEEKHFDKVFGYFTDQSCPVETCQQMIGRIRDVGSKELYMCLNATGNTLPDTIDNIKKMLHVQRGNLSKTFKVSGLQAEYGANGEVSYHSGDYFQLWLENMRMRNLSKNSFIRRFIHIVSTTGAQINFLSDDLYGDKSGIPMFIDGGLNDELLIIANDHATAKKEIKSEVIKKVSESDDLGEEAVDEIHTLMMSQEDITEDQKYAFEKHRLRVDYQYNGVIDEKFVRRYNTPKVRRVYKNLVRISPYADMETAWRQIQLEERAGHKYLMDIGETAYCQDLNRKYVFDQHRYALSLLKLCGWNSILDKEYIHQVLLTSNLKTRDKLYWSNIYPACVEFGIRSPNRNAAMHCATNDSAFIKYLLKPINKILDTMYAIRVTERKNDPGMFFIARDNLFTFSPEVSATRGIPLISVQEPEVAKVIVYEDPEMNFRESPLPI